MEFTKGRILTVGEIKNLPENTPIYLWCMDEENVVIEDGFLEFEGECDGDYYTTCGVNFNFDNYSDDTLVSKLESCLRWYTIREAIIE